MVETEQRGRGVTLTVSDNGPGIPRESREQVLTRFFRLDASRSLPGSGIGLSIVAAAAREVIITEGQAAPLLFTLYSGIAIRCRAVANGKNQLLSIVLPGALVGLEFLYRETSSCTVQAVTDVTYCRFDRERRRAELIHVPEMAHRVCERLLLDQRHLEDRLTAISACTAEGATAHFFLRLYDRLRARRLCRDGSFALPLTNRQIADAVGMTTVHLHRTLNKLKSKGILTHEQHRIVAHDEEKLRELACLPAEQGDRPVV